MSSCVIRDESAITLNYHTTQPKNNVYRQVSLPEEHRSRNWMCKCLQQVAKKKGKKIYCKWPIQQITADGLTANRTNTISYKMIKDLTGSNALSLEI